MGLLLRKRLFQLVKNNALAQYVYGTVKTFVSTPTVILKLIWLLFVVIAGTYVVWWKLKQLVRIALDRYL